MCVPLWETFYYSTCVHPSVGDILLQHMCSHVQSSCAVPEFGTFHKDFGPHELLYSIQFTSLYLLNSKLHRLPIFNASHHTISPWDNIFLCLAQEQCRRYEVRYPVGFQTTTPSGTVGVFKSFVYVGVLLLLICSVS